MARWTLEGDYFENCSCEILCLCLLSHAQAEPTNGECNGALAFHVDRGSCDGVDLTGLNAAVLFSARGPMANGNWTVGLYVDEAASGPQRDALVQIFSGSLGGPPAAIAALAGRNLGVKAVPMRYGLDRKTRSFQIPGLIDMNVEAILGADDEVVWLETCSTRWLDGCRPLAAPQRRSATTASRGTTRGATDTSRPSAGLHELDLPSP